MRQFDLNIEKVLEGWAVSYAIREIIANALDEQKLTDNTVRNIIKKGMTPLYHGKVLRFKARTAWKEYQKNRRLAALRDSLLSRLMNGEIDVSEIQL